jgi:anti-anti-sigma factor
MPSLTTEFFDNHDNTCTLKWIGSVENRNHHLMWFFDNSDILLQQMSAANIRKLIIDLAMTERIDSDGMRRLFNTRQDFIQKNVQIALHHPNSHLRRLLRIMQFDQIFEVEP